MINYTKLKRVAIILFIAVLIQYSSFAQLTGWQYYMPITITENSGTNLTDYQVLLFFDTQTLIATNKMNADGSDIRFAKDIAGDTLISYWIESGINTDSTKIWMKVPLMPASGSVDIYLIYGNSSATAVSDGQTTFDLYDNLDSLVTAFSYECGSITDSYVPPSKVSFSWSGDGVYTSNIIFPDSIVFTVEANVTAISGSWPGIYWKLAGSGEGYSLLTNAGSSDVRIGKTGGGSGFCASEGWASTVFNYTNISGIWRHTWIATGNIESYFPTVGLITSTDTDHSKTGNLKLALGGIQSGSGTIELDWIRVRKYSTAEPTGNIGIEKAFTSLNVSDTTVCLGASFTLNLEIDSNTTLIPPYSFFWSPSADLNCDTCQNPVSTPTSTTTYTVLLTDSVGTIDSALVTVTVFSSLPVASAGSDTTICEGSSVQLNATGGASYLWETGEGLSDSTISNPIASPSISTSYVVTATNSCGSDADTIDVFVNALPVLLSNDSTLCYGDAIQLEAIGGISYAWSPGTYLDDSTIANPVAIPNNNITYQLISVSNQGCTLISTITLVVDSVSFFNIDVTNDTICSGSTTQLFVNSCTSYIDDIDPSYDTALWASITGGFAGTDCGSVSGNALYFNASGERSATTNNLNMLGGGTVSFYLKIGSGSSPCENADSGEDVALIYSIDNGTNWDTVNVYDTEDYNTFIQITEIVPSGAWSSSTQFRWIQVDHSGSGYDVWSLDDISISCSGSDSSFNYSWVPTAGLSDPNSSEPFASPGTTTTYVVTVSAGSCSLTNSVTIYVDTFNLMVASPDTFVCYGDSVQLNATGSGFYVWSPATGLSCTNCQSPSASPTSTTTYYVSSPLGCGPMDSVTVIVGGGPIFASTDRDSICKGDSIQLTAYTCASPGDFYDGFESGNISTWVDEGGSYTKQVTTTNPYNGSYSLELIGGASGHMDGISHTFPSTTPEYISWYMKSTSTSDYGGFIVVGDNPTGSLDGIIYIQMSSSGQFYHNSGSVGSYNANQWYFIELKNIDFTAKSYDLYIDNILITSSAAFRNTTLTAVNEIHYYNWSSSDNSYLDDIQIGTGCTQIDTSLSYTWSPSAGLSNPNIADPLASPASTVTYIVSTSIDSSCVSSDTITIYVDTVNVVVASPDTFVCYGDSIQLNATGSGFYVWSPTTGLSCTNCQSPYASPSTTTTYYVSSPLGCAPMDSVTVIVGGGSIFASTNNDSICLGDSIQLTAYTCASPGDFYDGFESGNISTWIDEGGAYTKQVTSSSPGNGSYALEMIGGTSTHLSGLSHTFTQSSPDYISFKIKSSTNTVNNNSYVIIGDNPATWDDGIIYLHMNSNGNIWINSGNVAPTLYNANQWYNIELMNIDFVTKTYDYYVNGGLISSGVSFLNSSLNSINEVHLYGYSSGEYSYFDDIQIGTSCTQIDTSLSYTWSPSAGLSNPNIADPLASPASTVTYTVSTSIGGNCTSSDTITIYVDTVNYVVASSDTSICFGDSVQLNASGSGSYIWSPATGLSCTNCQNPYANPITTTTYYVSTPAGCTPMDSVTVTVNGVSSLSTYSFSPDPKQGSGTYDTCGIDNTGDYIDWVEISPVDQNTIHVRIQWYPSSSGTYTTNNGVHLKALHYNGTAWSGIYSNIMTPSDFTVDVIQIVEFDFTIPGGSPVGTHYIRAMLIDRGSNTDEFAVGITCADADVAGTDSSSSGRHFDNDDVSFDILSSSFTVSADRDTICLGELVQLQVLGTDSTFTHLWTPSSGLSDPNIANPQATPVNTTTYIVEVSVSNCSNMDTITIYVDTVNYVVASSDTSICFGDSVQLNASASLLGSSFSWSPSTGLSCSDCSNPIASPVSTTTYTVTASSGSCSDEESITITINNNIPTAASCTPYTTSYCCGYGIMNVTLNSINNTTANGIDSYQDYTCSNTTNLMINQIYPISVQTNPSNNENVRVWIDYNNDGVFDNDSTTELVFWSDNVLEYHIGNISIPGSAVLNTPVRMRVGSDAEWNTPPAPCTNILRGQFEDYTVIIVPDNLPPVADFTVEILDTCQGMFSFIDQSGYNPTSWYWDFGQGNTSTSQNAYSNYLSSGVYNVSLIVTNSFGSDTITKSIQTYAIEANFSFADPVSAGQAVQYTDLSQGAISWFWDFGDGYSANIQNPITIYNTKGNYLVTLTVQNNYGCSDNISKTIVVTYPDGIKGANNDEYLNVYPNPAKSWISINYSFIGEKELEVSVLNYLGQEIFFEAVISKNLYEKSFDMSDYSKGIYVIKIRSNSRLLIRRISLQ